MKSRTGKAKNKAAPEKNRTWFERKVAELKAEIDRLPADRQETLRNDLNKGKDD
jgi:hypothetical protein